MKEYAKPKIEIISLDNIDIITCSNPFEEIDDPVVW